MTANRWEELRREARLLENDIDSKLLAFSKFASRDSTSSSSESVPLLEDTNDVFERITSEIERLLKKLTDINNNMSEYTKQVQNSSAIYTVQRHREILNDYSNEFRKTRSNMMDVIQREQLLSGNKRNTDYPSLSSTNKITDLYLKEQEHIRNSEIMIEEQINIASRTRENLINQRTTFKAFQTQMTTLANRFPLINSLIHRINIRKRKDTIIISGVIAVCTFFLIIFIF
ncbi:Golgi SNAP receptor complex member 1-like [Panonychus citri]|uniref:Golgi SNAP receptor complex member 1-like n=1 Tax=Panonychus citri TaxID=50023 RepID=UPI002307DB9F|nr:Golgi SNAP receptor complex member 1-like [Panonychus citri]